MKQEIIIRNAEVWQAGVFRKLDLRISGGKIAEINESIEGNAVEEIQGAGMHILPGLCDLHVHFREPGYEYKETIASGSRAAAKGGFTLVCTMPNLNPAPDSLENLEPQLEAIRKEAVVKVLPYATITRQRMGNIPVDFEALKDYVAGFTDDGSGIQSTLVMEEAMKGIAPTGKMLAAHCESNFLLKRGYIHDGEYASLHGHRGISSESEWREVSRDIEISARTGCPLHVCHISTRESVQLIRNAKKRGLKVTCETGPHYLRFTDMDLKEDGRFKMNPPIRSVEDRAELLRGIADGTIDAIATDHAPHSEDEKSRGLEKSAMGVTGLETSLPASYTTLVATGRISLEKLVELMAVNPRRILGLETSIKEGDRADFTLVDFQHEEVVYPAKFISKGKSSPFAGLSLKGKVVMTVCNGKIVYKNDSLGLEE